MYITLLGVERSDYFNRPSFSDTVSIVNKDLPQALNEIETVTEFETLNLN